MFLSLVDCSWGAFKSIDVTGGLVVAHGLGLIQVWMLRNGPSLLPRATMFWLSNLVSCAGL